jgi:two-component system response regulator
MKNKVILLVEDNPDDAQLTLRALKRSNIANDIIIAHDGVEAIDYLLATGKYTGRDMTILPQLVLLDLKMPRLDGFDVLYRLRSDDRTRLLPVVVLTTSSEDQDRVESYKLGANSYIRKPVDFSQFMDAIQQMELYWLLLNEAP